jgi:hypothetical protein
MLFAYLATCERIRGPHEMVPTPRATTSTTNP